MQHHASTTALPSWQTLIPWGALIAVATALTYALSLGNGFVALDDPYVIVNNPAIRSMSAENIKTVFSTYDPELYIPLTFVSFQADHAIAGLHATQYHLTNLLLHIGNSLLVAWIALLLLRRKPAAIFCGLLFALHPVNAEVVAWATSRKEALSTFFLLLSVCGYLSYRETDGRWPYRFSVGAFALALLSKVTVFTLPLLLFLLDWREGRKPNRHAFIEKIPYFLLSAVFVAVGIIPKLGILSSTTTWEKILMAARSTALYLRILVAPFHLSVLYPNRNPISLMSPDFALSAVLPIALAAVMILSLRKTREIAFGFAFFFVAIGPTFVHFNRNAAIQSASGGGIQIASDHYMYVPAIGLFLLAGVAFGLLADRMHNRRMRQRLMAGTAALMIVLAVLSALQSRVWHDSETLFAHTLKHYPHSIAARVNLSVIYRKTGRFADERLILEEGLTYGQNSKLLTGLASIEKRDGDLQKATELYEQAIAADPANSEPHFGLGVLRADIGDTPAAYQSYFRALALDSTYVAAYNNLGVLYLRDGMRKEARQAFATAAVINPQSIEAHYNLGALYSDDGKLPEAAREFAAVVTIDPQNAGAYAQLAMIALRQGHALDAVNAFQKGYDINPDDPSVLKALDELDAKGLIRTR